MVKALLMTSKVPGSSLGRCGGFYLFSGRSLPRLILILHSEKSKKIDKHINTAWKISKLLVRNKASLSHHDGTIHKTVDGETPTRTSNTVAKNTRCQSGERETGTQQTHDNGVFASTRLTL